MPVEMASPGKPASATSKAVVKADVAETDGTGEIVAASRGLTDDTTCVEVH
jgi:hypothetical protein